MCRELVRSKDFVSKGLEELKAKGTRLKKTIISTKLVDSTVLTIRPFYYQAQLKKLFGKGRLDAIAAFVVLRYPLRKSATERAKFRCLRHQ
jgi:hypothetical protein